MNYSSEILDYLAGVDVPCGLILAPNAPPVIKTADSLTVALHAVLDASDVMDTLTALLSHAPKSGQGPIPASGSFSFGVRDMGRIRVQYITQRGSKVATVGRIPYKIPTTESICDDPEAVQHLQEFVEADSRGGVLAVSGPSAVSNATLVYSLLARANRTHRLIICALERALTYLMAHAESVVVQSDLDADIKDFAEGLQNALMLEPDILYVGNIRSDDALPGLADIVLGKARTILSSVSLDGRALLARCSLAQESGHLPADLPVTLIRVLPGAGGKVIVAHKEILTKA